MTYTEAKNAAEAGMMSKFEALKTVVSGKVSLSAYEKAKGELVKAILEYNTAVKNELFESYSKEEKPIIAAVNAFTLPVKDLKETINDRGITTSVELKDKTARLDINEFVEFIGGDKNWLYKCADLLHMLQLRELDLFNLTEAELAKQSLLVVRAVTDGKKAEKNAEAAEKAYEAAKAAKTPAAGRLKKVAEAARDYADSFKNPVSNTSLVKTVQEIYDLAIYEDNGSGKNAHKATNKDVLFIQDAAISYDRKAKCGLRSMNTHNFQLVIVSILHRVLNNVAYTIKCPKAN